jgi:peptidoglycan LD-endopeptidase LytH
MVPPSRNRPASTRVRRLSVALTSGALFLAAACDMDRVLPGRARASTAHERYAESLRDAGLDSSALGRDWLTAGDSVLRAPLQTTLPLVEAGAYTRDEARAVAYRVRLREGQRLDVSLEAAGLPARIFVDLFEEEGDSTRALAQRTFLHRATGEPRADSAQVAGADSVAARLTLSHEAGADGTFVLRVQPELLRAGRFTLRMQIAPTLAFPVDGAGNRAILSLFGVARDGGRRSHHGIDIFAPRGTPVLASANGIVRSTTPNQLGGIVVWLTDTARSQSLYYAHLDRHVVAAGMPVRVGDTLGFVGNTGNARTTAPHLHFGIYRRPRGPVDPLQHVWQHPTATGKALDTTWLGRAATARGRTVALRVAPAVNADTIRRLPVQMALTVRGATGSWLRVVLPDGTSGYVEQRALTTAE